MTKTRLALVSLLLLPAVSLADPVTIDWTGELVSYSSTDGSSAPATTGISGSIFYDSSLLPAPDAGNPPGVFSVTGADFLQATVNWGGGVFQTGMGGGDGSDTLQLDGGADQYVLGAGGTYTDSYGSAHQTLFSFGLLNAPDSLFTSLGLPAPGASGAPLGGGDFVDINLPAQTNWTAVYQLDNVNVRTVSAPEIDSATAFGALSFLALGMTVIRNRRNRQGLLTVRAGRDR